ncbi:autophagy protein Apg6-domain-containing protein [Radiomyces spectabilis]|uniref:autophagy protein Apg6-domain-containing protein n=1 Tax=Radiomyces spectabilis TaxID=64574 RepID=UPI00221EBF27|nr:autophagy protein Apg6-domain-containing protein [Radiomyces spectabilis]KAI8369425.1 autophagy protein Apg6-domain-containing protein [Radiomyces spectabilis]
MQSILCQRCKNPLRIDDSLTDLDSTSADLLIAPLLAEEHYKQQVKSSLLPSAAPSSSQPVSRRIIGNNKLPFNAPLPGTVVGSHSNQRKQRESYPAPSESFVVLSRSQVGPAAPMAAAGTSSSSGSPANGGDTTNVSRTPINQGYSGATISGLDHHGTRNNSLSHRLKVANRLFDVMSSKSSVDHPMCQECTDMLLEALEKQLDNVGRERDCYIDFLKKIKDSQVSEEEEISLRKQVEELKLQEDEAYKELAKTEEERKALALELAQLEKEMEALDKEQEHFWDKTNEYQITLQTFQNERDSINLKYDQDVKQYEWLQKTVVYNDAFCISHDGPFGTINGFRLGRLSSQPVEWSEINAAWGQTLLLLYTVANKLKFQFKTYRLVPMGSFSRIEKVEGDSVLSYELYGSGDFGLNRMFLNRRFDHAMVAMLNCLKQLTDFAEERDRSLHLPYRIKKDKIGELSIRLQFNQDELWTKALKYMLTNMKWILVFASRANTAVEPTNHDIPPSP